MNATQTVDPSVSRTPLPLHATDLPTVCVLCSHNCGIHVDVVDGRIAAVRADDTNPITTGYICNKAFSIPAYVRHAQRVEHPLRRRSDGSFERITWDVAIKEIAATLDGIRRRHSPRAIGLVGIGGQANHMDAPYGIGFLRSLGSRRWFNAFAQEKTQHALMDQWMFNASPAVLLHADMEHARFLLVLGTNPRISNRGHNATESFRSFVQDPSRTLVVVDPRETETTRQAREQLDLLVVIEPAMTETAQAADYVLPTPVGYEKWEIANFPKGYPAVHVQLRPPVVPGPPEALPEPEIYTRLAEAMDLFGDPPTELRELARHAIEPDGGAAFIATAQQLAAADPKAAKDPSNQILFWAYRTLGPHLPAPSLVAVWLLSGLNALLRPAAILRVLGTEWEGKSPFEIAAELFRLILAHPEGVEIARVSEATNFEDHVGFDDGRVRLAPEPMLPEIRRAAPRTRPGVSVHSRSRVAHALDGQHHYA
jgi:anaerobic selenocysteine-containing dehydrogenase